MNTTDEKGHTGEIETPSVPADASSLVYTLVDPRIELS